MACPAASSSSPVDAGSCCAAAAPFWHSASGEEERPPSLSEAALAEKQQELADRAPAAPAGVAAASSEGVAAASSEPQRVSACIFTEVVETADNADPVLRHHLALLWSLTRELRPILQWMENAFYSLSEFQRRFISHYGAVGEAETGQGNATHVVAW